MHFAQGYSGLAYPMNEGQTTNSGEVNMALNDTMVTKNARAISKLVYPHLSPRAVEKYSMKNLRVKLKPEHTSIM